MQKKSDIAAGRTSHSTDLVALDGQVREWIADPHRYFKAFSRTARRFQHTHPSARLRVMTFVGCPEEFLSRRPLRVHLLEKTTPVHSWEEVLSAVVATVVMARPALVLELSRAGLVPWMVNLEPEVDLLEAFRRGKVNLSLNSLADAFRSAQWLMLMADVKLNEAVVQVDSYTDEEWKVREAELQGKRAEEKRILQEIDLARKQYAEAHPEAQRGDASGASSDTYLF